MPRWSAPPPCRFFALGGMQPELARAAREHGGQGVAVLRGLWNLAGG